MSVFVKPLSTFSSIATYGKAFEKSRKSHRRTPPMHLFLRKVVSIGQQLAKKGLNYRVSPVSFVGKFLRSTILQFM